jgi:hypothetical protein
MVSFGYHLILIRSTVTPPFCIFSRFAHQKVQQKSANHAKHGRIQRIHRRLRKEGGWQNIPLFCNNNPKNKECGKLEFSTLSTGFQQQVAQRNSSK